MSGTIVVRCPADLHHALAAEAEAQGVSLNNLCVSLLAGGIGFETSHKLRKEASEDA